MSNAVVSFIIPCFNQSNYLGEALESVLAQTYTNWECIIVNDGSTDNTHHIAQTYLEKDKRFTYFKKENGGLSAARNEGLKIARGSWIQFLDADDYIKPEKLELSMKMADEDSSIDIIVSDFKMFINTPLDAELAFCKIIQDRLNYESILFEWGLFVIPIHCGFFTKKLFENVLFDEKLKAIEDWVMWIEIFKNGAQAKYLDNPLAYYRNNPQSMTKDRRFFRNSLVKAYNHIINIIPDKDVRKFSCIIIERLNNNYNDLESDYLVIKKTAFYTFEIRIKNLLHKLLMKR